MIKSIIFDLGGVLVDLDVDSCKKAFRDDVGYMQIDNDLDACHQQGIIGMLEEGLITKDEFHVAILAQSNPGVTAQEVDRSFRKILKGIAPYKVELLKRLSKEYDLYILSNNNEVCFPKCQKIFADAGIPMDAYFRKYLCSYQIQALKPSLKFYQDSIKELGIKPEESIFIDDSQRNVDGAIAAGLPAIWYDPATDLRECLAKMDLKRF